ncbi:4-hydroxythreonine-4-phosphate dehydrogenase [Wenyingzhuangia fucanilytica]|uniref:4-hydroxythreonine-4-phosphate dehydrogenase n=1 Tax=Wenyingzhuangia fucanilytica TaxID=1790137 RepID=A0A1B1Y840_9FLAO|nr:4-hydroxythreonine-4-phosphate dehydrogenase PdxA [Wenyingzhuangia fucanilytica]ANW96899.1 4-hydroxythreonine-4-phosphate dehydrogenase [Wenyingzhuangia fucanilytica]
MSDNRIIRVGISVGDLNGVGIELILKTFEDKRMYDLCTPVVYASDKVISFYKKQLKFNYPINFIANAEGIEEGKLNVIKVWEEMVELQPGTPTQISGQKAFESLAAATESLNKDEIDVLLTAPISKDNIQSEEFSFPGHTEYLESKIDGESLMILMSNDIKVGLVTGHIPVTEVSKTLNKDLICKKIDIMYQSLLQDFGVSKPKIAVLGLNPHCGDHGVIGKEDDELIRPILEEYQEGGKLVYGPYAADGFFGNRSYLKFDAVISMYHDQGLVGFKAISFGEGVNFTAGLSKVRVSPDHGTAFDVAGKGVANTSSFQEALYKGISIIKKRKEYQNLTANTLKTKK